MKASSTRTGICRLISCLLGIIAVIAAGCTGGALQARPQIARPAEQELASWGERARKMLLRRVEELSKRFPPSERIAAIDLDGTTFVERPDYSEVVLAVKVVTEKIAKGVPIADLEVMNAVKSNDKDWIAKNGGRVIVGAYANSDPQQLHIATWQFLNEPHPSLKRQWRALFYKPMIELIRYMHSQGFRVYIVTGSQQDFVRSFAEECIGVEPSAVIGDLLQLRLDKKNPSSTVIFGEKWWEPSNTKDGKVLRLFERTGRMPLIAVGNSMGDLEMLQSAHNQHGIPIVVDHDDDTREFIYEDAVKVEAKRSGWIVVSMKNDWLDLYSTCTRDPSDGEKR